SLPHEKDAQNEHAHLPGVPQGVRSRRHDLDARSLRHSLEARLRRLLRCRGKTHRTVGVRPGRRRRGPRARRLLTPQDAHMTPTQRTRRIAWLNDLARTAMGVASKAVMTPGIAAFSSTDQSVIREKVERFDAFTPDNDPCGEHDFGMFEHNGE